LHDLGGDGYCIDSTGVFFRWEVSERDKGDVLQDGVVGEVLSWAV